MSTGQPITLAAIGLDHRHIYGMLAGMLDAGNRCKAWWTEGEPEPLAGFVKRFPDIPRENDLDKLLADPEIDMVLIAVPPYQRSDLAVRAMDAGKDVIVDKPGCTTLEQLADLRACVARTGRIWSIDFSERFEVPAVAKASELIAQGAIGTVVQTVALGPHRLNRHMRPDWFFDARGGGILCDIASHQIDQFLFFTGSEDAEIVACTIGNFANPNDREFEDFGEILLRGSTASGYLRVDWYTPDALPTWGDGRLTIQGTEGQIELRKYIDVAGRPGTDHVFLVNGDRCEHIDASGEPLTYFSNLTNDVRDRTQTAMAQSNAFRVSELAIQAQNQAVRIGHLARGKKES
jgi:predicted dehydrogenase